MIIPYQLYYETLRKDKDMKRLYSKISAVYVRKLSREVILKIVKQVNEERKTLISIFYLPNNFLME